MTTSFDGSAKTCFVLDNQHCHVLNYEGSKLTPLSSKGLARQMKRKKDVSANHVFSQASINGTRVCKDKQTFGAERNLHKGM